jgi:dihydroorotase
VKSITEKSKAVNDGLVDVFCVGAVTKGREGNELAPMMELAEAGVVGFTDDGAPVMDADKMRRALEYASMLKKPILQHAEDISMTKGGVMNEGFVATSLGLPPMPSVAEEIMVARDIKLVEYVKAQYHVAHISTAGTVELIRNAKQKKLPVTCEVTPHHFSLTDDAVRSFDTNTKMNPPLRTQDDVEALKEGLKDGTIDVIATDHAPHSFDEKQVEFAYAPFGIVGLETALGLCCTELVEKKILTLIQLIEKLSVNPRKILHLPDIKIAEGEEANLTFLDPAREWTVNVNEFKSKSKNSPFDGWKLKGKAIGIINNGVLLLS